MFYLFIVLSDCVPDPNFHENKIINLKNIFEVILYIIKTKTVSLKYNFILTFVFLNKNI